MLVRIFKTNQPIIIVLVIAVAFVLELPALLHTTIALFPSDAPISGLPIYGYLNQLLLKNLNLAGIAGFMLLVINALYFNHLVQKFELIGKPSYLPALIFLVFSTLTKEQLVISPVLIVELLLLIVLDLLLNSFHAQDALSVCFESGILIAIASLIYLPASPLLLFVVIAIGTMRSFAWKEFFGVLLGFLFPIIYLATYYFYTDQLRSIFLSCIRNPIIQNTHSYTIQSFQPYLEVGIFVLLSFMLSLGRGRNSNQRSVQYRSSINTLRWLFVLGGAIIYVAPNLNFINFSIALLPLTIVVANYFAGARVIWLAEMMMYILISLIIFNRFG